MGFFVDRLVEHPGRIKLTDVSSGTEQVVDVNREEGNIIEEGTLLNASNLNYGTTLGEVQIDPTAPAGTTDGDLYAAIDGKGWVADVIVGGLLQVKAMLKNIMGNISGLLPKKNVAAGRVNVPTIQANSYGDVEITHNLGSNVRVYGMLFSTGTATNIGSVTVALTVKGTSTATFRVFNDRPTSITPAIEWFAINNR